MHKHKSAPIAALPRLGPHPRNGRPSALEVILRRPQEPPELHNLLARVLPLCSPASSHRARQRLHLHNGRRRPARQERTVRLSRLVSFHALLLSPQCHTTGPGMAPVLLADAGILATACTNTRAPPSPPCPVSALTRGMVVRVPSKSFSAARKNRLLQSLSHRSCALSGCCPPTPPLSSGSRQAASTVLRARSHSTVLTPSTPMAVGVLRLHQRHALAR